MRRIGWLVAVAAVMAGLAGCSGRVNSDGSMDFKFDPDGASKWTTNYVTMYAQAKTDFQLAAPGSRDQLLANNKMDAGDSAYGMLVKAACDRVYDYLKNLQVNVNSTALTAPGVIGGTSTPAAATTRPSLQPVNPDPAP